MKNKDKNKNRLLPVFIRYNYTLVEKIITFYGILGRSWYGHKGYVWSYGAKIDTNYDWTRKLSSGLIVMAANNVYDDYNHLMGGQTYNVLPHFTYYIDSTKYIELLGELGRETAKVDSFANYNFGLWYGNALWLYYLFRILFCSGRL